jgi:hypothetical protein
MFSNNRESMRRVFIEAWRKSRAKEPLQPLEQLVAEVIGKHPEYHPLLQSDEKALQREYLPDGGETNPFLHMGMHISLLEQIGSDRPPGIRHLYQRIAAADGDPHQAEHRMMDCLGLSLWQAQRSGTHPDENAYLQCLRKLVGEAGE